ncbi:hypothetical protein D0862_02307 [Hortaea werneckii]|uniref:Protein kinase domain-containing protein n=1 Tax=Hortaea werneckii TaxID=91943 RepID=A0A3M7HK94_HORWE|nr:hypothetical protein D0862_02307 [Hortaea werneckii]
MQFRSRVFHASTPQITLPPEWFASRQSSPLRRFPDKGCRLIDSTTKIEEEKWSWAHKYVVAKICETVDTSDERELLAYTRINSLKSSHNGSSLLRNMLDTFKISNRHQKHTCLIHEPLGMSLETCRSFFPDRKFPDLMIKSTLKHLLIALNFLHTEAGIVHTGMMPGYQAIRRIY